MLSIHQLSDSERVKLGVVSFLCSLCQYPTGQTAATIKSELLDLLEEEKGWDPTKAYDLQLVRLWSTGQLNAISLIYNIPN